MSGLLHGSVAEWCKACCDEIRAKTGSNELIKAQDIPSKILSIPTASGGLQVTTSLELVADKVKTTGPVTLTATLKADYDDINPLNIDFHGFLIHADVSFFSSDGTLLYHGITNLNGEVSFTATITEDCSFYCLYYGTGDYNPCMSNNVNVEYLDIPYQYVEWIGSSGTQYINTGVKGTEIYGVETEMLPTAQSSYQGYFGNLSEDDFNIAGWTSITKGYFRCREQELYQDKAVFSTTNFNTIKVKDGTYIVGSASGTIDTSTPLSVNNTDVCVFCCWGLSRKSRAKFKRVKIYGANGVLIRDLVPCYEISNPSNIGMYDEVESKFYGNSGSGSFTKGGDVL